MWSARPLYQLLKEAQREGTMKLQWEPDAIKAYEALKKALLQAPCLSRPTGYQFNLFVTERSRLALGVLTQPRGEMQQPVAYLSKELDPVAKGWPHCLRSVAATALLAPETTKLTLGRDLIVHEPHNITGLLKTRGDLWYQTAGY